MKLYTEETLIQARIDAVEDSIIGSFTPYDLSEYEAIAGSTLEDFIGDPADEMTFADSIYALYSGLRMLKEAKQRETPEGQMSFVAANCFSMIEKLKEQYPDWTTFAEIEYELRRTQ